MDADIIVNNLVDEYAKHCRADFLDSLDVPLFFAKSNSPIERVLLAALNYLIKLNGKDLDDIVIGVQSHINNYRVDFEIRRYLKDGNYRALFVECDSQKWHERTEKERRYEKQRDRFITKSGFTVWHYTGNEILNNYLGIAEEIILFLMDYKDGDIITSSWYGEE